MAFMVKRGNDMVRGYTRIEEFVANAILGPIFLNPEFTAPNVHMHDWGVDAVFPLPANIHKDIAGSLVV